MTATIVAPKRGKAVLMCVCGHAMDRRAMVWEPMPPGYRNPTIHRKIMHAKCAAVAWLYDTTQDAA